MPYVEQTTSINSADQTRMIQLYLESTHRGSIHTQTSEHIGGRRPTVTLPLSPNQHTTKQLLPDAHVNILQKLRAVDATHQCTYLAALGHNNRLHPYGEQNKKKQTPPYTYKKNKERKKRLTLFFFPFFFFYTLACVVESTPACRVQVVANDERNAFASCNNASKSQPNHAREKCTRCTARTS